MAGMAIDGLISGINTTELINNLMKLEAAPQLLLKKKSTETSNLVSALQALNTKVASLGTNAANAAKVTSWEVHRVASSSAAATASASGAAAAGSLEFSVDRLSAGQVSMVNLGGADLGTPPRLTVVRDGKVYTVDATGDLDDIAKAINAAKDLGLSAVKVRVSNGVAGGEPEYRLQLSGISGQGNAFDVYAGDAVALGYVTDDGEGTVTENAGAAAIRLAHGIPPAADDPARPLIAAQDAQITLWPSAGSADPVRLTSATNTFAGVMTGVDVTVGATTSAGSPAVLTVSPDADAMRKLVSDVVGSVGVVLSDIASRTASTTTTDADGRTVVTGGLFSGDSAIRGLADSVRNAVSYPVEGRSPSEIGIKLDRYGAITFDQAAFDAAMAKDPDGTQKMAMAIAARVQDVAESASDPIDGTLTLKVTAQEDAVKDLGRQIADWDRRLELRREGLQRTYSALEVALSRMQSQQSWLAGQLATLPQANTGK
ncbi:flagellar filament capping protein FliD [Georgenia ruanii]|uniref:Flagellar hook-associated protein 2 n=1 Tax=Georgenia ruanii TaxID=348442 RepID=A0A7J9UYL5_9MICO|nr:flagellar filament capping protein FliD [Georgenia ruanii]MPV89706.1 flagellar filament capping protein FliD [Georgenia ruanii]